MLFRVGRQQLENAAPVRERLERGAGVRGFAGETVQLRGVNQAATTGAGEQTGGHFAPTAGAANRGARRCLKHRRSRSEAAALLPREDAAR